MRIWTGILCSLTLAAAVLAQTRGEDDLAQARALGREGRPAEAIPLYEQLMAEVESSEGVNAWPLVYLAHELAVQHHSLGHALAAEELYRRSLAIAEGARGARDPVLVPSLRGLGAVAAMQGKLADAEAFHRRVLEIQEADAEARSGLARTLAELGLLCQLQERPADAEAYYRRALDLGDAGDLTDTEVATTAGNLAALYERRGRDDEAATLYARALELREGVLGPEHPDLVKTLRQLARLHERRRRFADAASCYERILRIREREATDDLALSGVLSRLAAAYRQLGRSREADAHFQMARSILSAQCGGREPPAGCREAMRLPQELADRAAIAAAPEPPPVPPAVPVKAPAPPSSTADALPAAAPSPASPPPAATRAARTYRAQVGARRDRSAAFELLERLRSSHAQLLGHLAVRVVRADLGERGVWYRVQIGEFPAARPARALCAELARRGHEGCWVIETGSP